MGGKPRRAPPLPIGKSFGSGQGSRGLGIQISISGLQFVYVATRGTDTPPSTMEGLSVSASVASHDNGIDVTWLP